MQKTFEVVKGINGLVLFFFFWSLVLVSWQAFISFIVMKLGFMSRPSSNSTLLFAGLQHMQQCQVNLPQFLLPCYWSKWMVHEKWSPQRGVGGGGEPTTFQSWVICLTTRPLRLAFGLVLLDYVSSWKYIFILMKLCWSHNVWKAVLLSKQ